MKKADLLEALEIVKPGLANKEQIEQSTSFAFMKNRVVTYNDEISISHPLKDLGIQGAVKADELYRLLNKLKGDEVEITENENEIVIESGRTKAGLVLEEEINLPLEEIGEKNEWHDLPEDFSKYVKLATGVCSRDMSRPVLTCIHIGGRYVESSDNFRIIRCKLDNKIPIPEFLLPATAAMELVKLNPVKIAEGVGWVHFQTEQRTVISCRLFEDKFPDVSDLLQVEGMEIKFPNTITEILDRAMVFSKRDHTMDESVEVTLKENKIELKSKSETGWFKESANVKYDDDPVSFATTPHLLRDILNETHTCILCEDRLKFEVDEWTYVTTLRSVK